eukprot:6210413-Pleurochrysis_carterae.AAC.2
MHLQRRRYACGEARLALVLVIAFKVDMISFSKYATFIAPALGSCTKLLQPTCARKEHGTQARANVYCISYILYKRTNRLGSTCIAMPESTAYACAGAGRISRGKCGLDAHASAFARACDAGSPQALATKQEVISAIN